MKVFTSIDEIPKIQNVVVSQGTFDGVHKAHKVILSRLKEIAENQNGETLLITFEPHPRMVLFPNDHGLKLLNTQEEKIELLNSVGIDNLLVIPFTKDFSRQSSLQFIRDVVVEKIGAKVLVVGYDHRFGKNREGSFENLQEYSNLYGFDLVRIPEQDVENVAVSSSKIRSALLIGDIEQATKYLDRFYSIEGKVIEGKKLGRTLGFPTANIKVVDENKLIPADGIYAVNVFIHKKQYGGMMNIGNNPTIANKGRSLEANIFEFDESIYNEKIKIEFVDKLRDEIKFDSISELQSQLIKDKLQATEVLKKYNSVVFDTDY